jgi:hypothetical protein
MGRGGVMLFGLRRRQKKIRKEDKGDKIKKK